MIGRSWYHRDVPETVGAIACAVDDGLALFEDGHVVFAEDGHAIVVAELADGDEAAAAEVGQDVAFLGMLNLSLYVIKIKKMLTS